MSKRGLLARRTMPAAWLRDARCGGGSKREEEGTRIVRRLATACGLAASRYPHHHAPLLSPLLKGLQSRSPGVARVLGVCVCVCVSMWETPSTFVLAWWWYWWCLLVLKSPRVSRRRMVCLLDFEESLMTPTIIIII